jgi:antitoxin HigA-1
MTIKREDIARHIVDFSDIASGRRLPPVHPGEILRDEFLTAMGISVYELANALRVPRSRVNDIVLGRRAITTDTAIRLGRYFGMSSEFWINLQARYDLDLADRTVRRKSSGRSHPGVRLNVNSFDVSLLKERCYATAGIEPTGRLSVNISRTTIRLSTPTE